jgi:glycosylphosphatidylinositol transamidase (GPIT) subunit GPI8
MRLPVRSSLTGTVGVYNDITESKKSVPAFVTFFAFVRNCERGISKLIVLIILGDKMERATMCFDNLTFSATYGRNNRANGIKALRSQTAPNLFIQ